MAWSTPSTQTNGTDIGQTEWNELVNDLIYLYTALNALASKEGEGYEQVVSSTAETTIATWTVSADTMGANGFFMSCIYLEGYNNSGAGATWHLRGKFGATTIYDPGALTMTNANYPRLRHEALVGNQNNTSLQLVSGDIWYNIYGTLDNYSYPISNYVNHFIGSSTEDTTGDLTFLWSIQLNTSNANTWAKSYAWLEGPMLEN